MNWTHTDLIAFEKRRMMKAEREFSFTGQSESKLHADIVKFCDSQWPRWKYIRARMDKKSTGPVFPALRQIHSNQDIFSYGISAAPDDGITPSWGT